MLRSQCTHAVSSPPAPDELARPSLVALSSSSISLTWLPPEAPNGVILGYNIYRDSVNVATTSMTQFNDTGLIPATGYSYFVEAFNIIGSTRSISASTQTLEGVPSGVSSPTLVAIGSTVVSASWSPPAVSNGVISRYELLLSVPSDGEVPDGEVQVVFVGLALEANVTGLTPFTVYSFVVQACTTGGCGPSPAADIQTGEAPPTFQPAPNVSTIDAVSLEVSWTTPPQPNGFVVQYSIYQRNDPFVGDGFLVDSVGATVRVVVVGGLRPFTEYEFSVASSTAVGGPTRSDWTRGLTAQSGTAHSQLTHGYSSQFFSLQFSPSFPFTFIFIFHLNLHAHSKHYSSMINLVTLINNAHVPFKYIV